METVGTARLAADRIDRPALFTQDQFELEPAPQWVINNPLRYQRLFATIPPKVEVYRFDESQYSIPVESRFEGINFRSISLDPKSMGLAVPLDEITKLPLPIVITDSSQLNCNTSFSDYHHHYHPERDLLNGDDAMIALRRSRGQDMPRWLHEHYHKFFAGPELPKTRQETFASVVLACAGVVPRKAIDFSVYEGPKIVEVWDDNQYSRMVASIKHEGEKHNRSSSFYRAQIGIFFANYAIEQSFEEVINNRLIDEFLTTKDMDRRKVLGNLMLSKAIDLSVEPVIPIHSVLKKHRIARKRDTDLGNLVKKFFVSSRRPDYYGAISRKLEVA